MASPGRERRPQLSVVLATRDGWPEIRPCIASFAAEARALGAEIVVADGSFAQSPQEVDLPPGARWLRRPGASVFQLYHTAFMAASGELVAATEDHCAARPGWLHAMIDAHARHPTAAAIGGAIENGSTGPLLDWASYFMTQGPHMSPLGDRRTSFISNESNVVYKRTAIEGLSDFGGLGAFLLLHNRALLAVGAELRVDDRIAVDHFQSLPAGETSWIHFHNGRSISGFRRRHMTRGDWARVGGAFLVPLYRTTRTVRIGWSKRRLRRTLVAAVPWMLWLECCHAAGSLIGYATGAGDSPDRLH